VERGEVYEFCGREVEIKQLVKGVQSDNPKCAVVGPSGSGKGQIAFGVALALAKLPQSRGSKAYPYARRLLRLDVELLLRSECSLPGSASRQLSAARKEMESAFADGGSSGQGVVFVLLVGMSLFTPALSYACFVIILIPLDNIKRALTQPSIASTLLSIILDSSAPIICSATQADWEDCLDLFPRLKQFDTCYLVSPPQPLAIKMGLDYAAMLAATSGVVITYPTVRLAVSLSYEYGSHLTAPGSVATLLKAASRNAQTESNGTTSFRNNMEAELNRCRNTLRSLELDCNAFLSTTPSETEKIRQEIAALVETLAKYPVDGQASQVEKLENRLEEIKKELADQHAIDDWTTMEVHGTRGDKTLALRGEAASIDHDLKRHHQGYRLPTRVTSDHLHLAAETLYRVRLLPLSAEEQQILSTLPVQVGHEIFGQSNALAPIIKDFMEAEGETGRTKPFGAYLLAGPPGCGKTATGGAFASIAFKNAGSCFLINCSRFVDHVSTYDLVGNPATGRKGRLIQHITQHPRSVVIFDEIEKGGLPVQRLLMEMAFKGVLEDTKTGNLVSCRSVLIFATTNAGQHHMTHKNSIDPVTESLVMNDILSTIAPEIVDRFDRIVIFKTLDSTAKCSIVDREAKLYIEKVAEQKNCSISIESNALTNIRAKVIHIVLLGDQGSGRGVKRRTYQLLRDILDGTHGDNPAMVPALNGRDVEICWNGLGGQPSDPEAGRFHLVVSD